MKLVIVLSLISLAYAVPQPRKTFHEHFDDFLDVIIEESGQEMEELNSKYVEFEEFTATIEYLETNDFKNIVYKMEDLPEFRAVVDFLEGHNIDILYFIDLLNNMIETFNPSRKLRQESSGNDMSSYIKDSIALFPKQKLSDLYDQKMEEDEDFKNAMDSLRSEEFEQLWDALWESEIFKVEADVLADNGLQLELFVEEALAIFGQN